MTKFATLAVAAASIFSLAFAHPTNDLARRQKPVKACSHLTGGVHVIAAPGEGFADPPYGLIGSLARSILAAIPGSSNVSVPYNHSETNGLLQTQQGAATMLQYVKDYHYYCPNTKIVLLGYSSGGVMGMNVMCGTSPPYNPVQAPLPKSTYADYVIAAITYGDESRNKGKKWNRGTCKDQGLHPRREPDNCRPWASYIRNYCDKEDPMCCVATGNDPESHYDYPQKYDQAATQFVVSQLKKFGGA